MSNSYSINRGNLRATLKQSTTTSARGRVESILGPVIKARLNAVSIGSLLRIECLDGSNVQAKVIGFDKEVAILSPLNSTKGLSSGAPIVHDSVESCVLGGEHLLGTIIDSNGHIIEKGSRCLKIELASKAIELERRAPGYHHLQSVDTTFHTGIRTVDSLLTIGKGQRIAVFAEPGVGKTSLLGAIANNSSAEINIIALIGERGREVRDFAESILDEATRSRSIIVASTSSDSAASRVQASLLATGIAEYFRDNGKDVLLTMDSLTRLFRSYRELGLAAGETPVRGGYPPSVFEQLPKLIERSGKTVTGTITAFYSVLLSESSQLDIMAEEVKGLSDGHIYLRKKIAEQGVYPAISILESLSRLQPQITSQEQQTQCANVQKFKSFYEEKKDILLFAEGKSQDLQTLDSSHQLLNSFLQQNIRESVPLQESQRQLSELSSTLSEAMGVLERRHLET